jgi:hypothetical protein
VVGLTAEVLQPWGWHMQQHVPHSYHTTRRHAKIIASLAMWPLAQHQVSIAASSACEMQHAVLLVSKDMRGNILTAWGIRRDKFCSHGVQCSCSLFLRLCRKRLPQHTYDLGMRLFCLYSLRAIPPINSIYHAPKYKCIPLAWQYARFAHICLHAPAP